MGSNWRHVCHLLCYMYCELVGCYMCTKKDVGIDVFHFGLRVLVWWAIHCHREVTVQAVDILWVDAVVVNDWNIQV